MAHSRSLPRSVRLLLGLALILPAFLVGGFASAVGADPIEYQVKAAYLSKFGNFVTWPSASLSAPDSTITICVLGEDPFGSALEKAVTGHLINDHPVVLRDLQTLPPDLGCQILYTADADVERVARLLKSVRGKGILTVTELPSGPAELGVINFVIKENHVRFEIDTRAAADNGISISSQLLGLAVAVKAQG